MPEKPPSENYHEVIAELRERIAYLESELGITQDAEAYKIWKDAFGLSAQEARALAALIRANGRILSHAQLEDAMCRPNDGDCLKISNVIICRVRHRVGYDAIETIWGHGYRLTPEGRARIAARVHLPVLNKVPSLSLISA